MRRLVCTVLALSLGGFALGKGFMLLRVDVQEMERLIAASPVIKVAGKQHFDPRPAGTRIEMYYKKFNLLTEPGGIEDWEWHYKMGEPSKPAWKYVRLGEVTIYRADRSDPHAILALRKAAAQLGGDAVIDLQREPIALKGSFKYGVKSSQEIVGYMFYGDVVRKKD